MAAPWGFRVVFVDFPHLVSRFPVGDRSAGVRSITFVHGSQVKKHQFVWLNRVHAWPLVRVSGIWTGLNDGVKAGLHYAFLQLQLVFNLADYGSFGNPVSKSIKADREGKVSFFSGLAQLGQLAFRLEEADVGDEWGKVLVKVRVWEFSVQGLVVGHGQAVLFNGPALEVLSPLLDFRGDLLPRVLVVKVANDVPVPG